MPTFNFVPPTPTHEAPRTIEYILKKIESNLELVHSHYNQLKELPLGGDKLDCAALAILLIHIERIQRNFSEIPAGHKIQLDELQQKIVLLANEITASLSEIQAKLPPLANKAEGPKLIVAGGGPI